MARTRTRNVNKAEEKTGQDAEVVSDSRRRRRNKQEVETVQQSQPETTRKDRPTPSARQAKPRGTGSTGLINRIPVVRGIVAYLRGVNSELQKVTWPNREEATHLTYIVLGVTASFAVTLGLLDVFLSWWFRKAFHEDTIIVFVAVAAAVLIAIGGAYTMLRDRI